MAHHRSRWRHPIGMGVAIVFHGEHGVIDSIAKGEYGSTVRVSFAETGVIRYIDVRLLE